MGNTEKEVTGSYLKPGAMDTAMNNIDGVQTVTHSRELILPTTKAPDDLEDGKCTTDPHSLVTHPTTYLETMLHILKGNIGAGLFAMGDAFRNGGIIFAPIMTVVLGIICVHAQHVLLDLSEDLCRQTKRDKPPCFAETVYLVFLHGPVRLRKLAPLMRVLVDAFLFATQLGFCCAYIVFIANTVQVICIQYNIHIDLSVHMVIVMIPILLSCMVRNLKYLTPFSTVANVMMAGGVAAVIYEASRDLPPIETRAYIAPFRQLPLFFGTAVYCFEGISLVLPLKNEMKQPKLFQKPLGPLNVSMVVIGSIFLAVGFLGYLKWGDDVQGSVTLNLEMGQVRSDVVRGLIALAIMFTYPLQLYVPVCITWPSLRNKYATTHPVIKELVYRAFLVLITFALAESIPHLGLFISLMGAVSSTTLALIFPPIIEMVSKSQQPGGISALTLIKDLIILLFGVLVFTTGSFESIVSIVKAFRE